MRLIIILLLGVFCVLCFPKHSHISNNIVQKTDYDSISILCNEREMYKMFEQNIFDTLPIPCNNLEAVGRFEEKINKLKLFIRNKDGKLLNEIVNIILNFELLTGIESESDGDYIGKHDPTDKDVERWLDWFYEHKDNLCWYKEKNVLFLKQCK